MKKNKIKNGTDDFEKVRMINMARTVRFLIKILSGVLVFIFGWLKLKGVETGIVVTDITAEALLRFSLLVYFTCWVLGTNNDVNDQELVYEKAPNSGIIPPSGYILIIAVPVVFGCMCYVNNYKTFSWLLLLFWCVNIIGWYYLVNKVYSRDVAFSLKKYNEEKKFYKYEILRISHEYISGRWQYYRFFVGFLIIIVNFILVYTEIPVFFSKLIDFKSPEIITSSGFIAYILLMEIWIWIKRVKVKTSFAMVDLFECKYKLSRININQFIN